MNAGFKWHKHDGSYFWYGNELGGVGYVWRSEGLWFAYYKSAGKTFRWKPSDGAICYPSEKEAFKCAKAFVSDHFKPEKVFKNPP